MTTTVHSPTAGRRRLRNVLRRARDAAALTQEQVAEEMDWSLSKVIRIETGGVGVSTSDLRQLLQLYQVTDPGEVADLIELARVGRQRPWWTRYKDAMPPGYLSYIGLEDESSGLRCVSPVGLPGLLQTEEYSRAIVEASWWALRADQQENAGSAMATQRMDVRRIRQREVLGRETPPEITAVLDEAVLWRQVGGPGVLRRQLLHLAELSQRPHIAIHVLPFHTSVVNMLSHFVILEFPDPADPDAVYVESAFDHTVLEGGDVATYRAAFEQLRRASLNEADSVALINQVASEVS